MIKRSLIITKEKRKTCYLLHFTWFKTIVLSFSAISCLCSSLVKFIKTLCVRLPCRSTPKHLTLLIHSRAHTINAISVTTTTRNRIFYVQIFWTFSSVSIANFGKIALACFRAADIPPWINLKLGR